MIVTRLAGVLWPSAGSDARRTRGLSPLFFILEPSRVLFVCEFLQNGVRRPGPVRELCSRLGPRVVRRDATSSSRYDADVMPRRRQHRSAEGRQSAFRACGETHAPPETHGRGRYETRATPINQHKWLRCAGLRRARLRGPAHQGRAVAPLRGFGETSSRLPTPVAEARRVSRRRPGSSRTVCRRRQQPAVNSRMLCR